MFAPAAASVFFLSQCCAQLTARFKDLRICLLAAIIDKLHAEAEFHQLPRQCDQPLIRFISRDENDHIIVFCLIHVGFSLVSISVVRIRRCIHMSSIPPPAIKVNEIRIF